MTTHFYVFELDKTLNSARGTGVHYAAADHLHIAHVVRVHCKPGDAYLVTTNDGIGGRNPWAGDPHRYRLTEHGPVEIRADGSPFSQHQVPLLLAAAARGPGIEAFAFGRWYPATVQDHTRTRIRVVVTTGSGVRPAKFYKPGEKTLRIAAACTAALSSEGEISFPGVAVQPAVTAA